MASEKVTLQFIAPYMMYNPGEVATFSAKAAKRLINSSVAEKAGETAKDEAKVAANAKLSAGEDLPEDKEDKPKRRRRGAVEE